MLDADTKGNLERIRIAVRPLASQRRIVRDIGAERALVEANRRLVEVFDRKIQAKLVDVWGEGGGKESQGE